MTVALRQFHTISSQHHRHGLKILTTFALFAATASCLSIRQRPAGPTPCIHVQFTFKLGDDTTILHNIPVTNCNGNEIFRALEIPIKAAGLNPPLPPIKGVSVNLEKFFDGFGAPINFNGSDQGHLNDLVCEFEPVGVFGVDDLLIGVLSRKCPASGELRNADGNPLGIQLLGCFFRSVTGSFLTDLKKGALDSEVCPAV
ncbi:hypothetical protein GLAREA_13006 [Glarea lozoyensis ATCC 20868]|uniref:Uncharacterized protein n=1 Tax=Glarea lozoyensis (strain ATCC 20868 / MF5171) TaxID=1116229 RepID=S3DV90_GLAL2|nr:uncharacterized protein GLAREA_13006 [Glarea lozoyensis ATCC 20868]EPE30283.1 hypothetical protein GLAREA_13006 [Glarea lozoyensis ATCC 20868]